MVASPAVSRAQSAYSQKCKFLMRPYTAHYRVLGTLSAPRATLYCPIHRTPAVERRRPPAQWRANRVP